MVGSTALRQGGMLLWVYMCCPWRPHRVGCKRAVLEDRDYTQSQFFLQKVEGRRACFLLQTRSEAAFLFLPKASTFGPDSALCYQAASSHSPHLSHPKSWLQLGWLVSSADCLQNSTIKSPENYISFPRAPPQLPASPLTSTRGSQGLTGLGWGG